VISAFRIYVAAMPLIHTKAATTSRNSSDAGCRAGDGAAEEIEGIIAEGWCV